MSQVILDDELRAKLKLDEGSVDLCDASGDVVAHLYTPERHARALRDRYWIESDTSAAKAEREQSLEAYRRGECVTSDRLFAEIAARLDRRAAS